MLYAVGTKATEGLFLKHPVPSVTDYKASQM